MYTKEIEEKDKKKLGTLNTSKICSFFLFENKVLSANHKFNLAATFVLSHSWPLKYSFLDRHICFCKCLLSMKWQLRFGTHIWYFTHPHMYTYIHMYAWVYTYHKHIWMYTYRSGQDKLSLDKQTPSVM